jgi:hypothetical protein
MTWVLLPAVLVLLFVVLPLARRRRRLFTGSRPEPISTACALRKHPKKKRDALDAATASLR